MSTSNHPGEPSGVSPRSPHEGRDASGRFTKGNKGGPGNPFARQTAALRQALVDAVTPDDIQAVAKALLERAKNGSESAAKLLFQYVLGKPEPMPHPDRLDLEEWQTFLAHEPVAYGLNKAMFSADPSLYLTLVRGTKAEVTDIVARDILLGMQDPKAWHEKHYGEPWQLVAERKKKGQNAEGAENAQACVPLTPGPSPRRGEGSQAAPRQTVANGSGVEACVPLTPGPSPRRGEGSKAAPRQTVDNGSGVEACVPLTPDPSPRRGERRQAALGNVGSVSVCGNGKPAKKQPSPTAANGATRPGELHDRERLLNR